MASWRSVLERLAREVERQGADVRRTKTGGFMVRNPVTGGTAALHGSPSRAAQSRHNIEQTLGHAGYELPTKFRL